MERVEEKLPSRVEQAYKRIQVIAQTRTQVELAKMLGIRQSSISDALRRGEIPDSWLVRLLDIFGVNPVWIKTGEAPQFLQGVDEMPHRTSLNRQQLTVTVEKALAPTVQHIVEEVLALAPPPTVHIEFVSNNLSGLALASNSTANHILDNCHPYGSFLEGDA